MSLHRSVLGLRLKWTHGVHTTLEFHHTSNIKWDDKLIIIYITQIFIIEIYLCVMLWCLDLGLKIGAETYELILYFYFAHKPWKLSINT